MTVKKLTSRLKNKIRNEESETKASFIMTIISSGVMLWLGLRYYSSGLNYDSAWGHYALYQSFMGFLGYIGSRLITGKPIIPREFAEFDKNTGFLAFLVFGAVVITQTITRFTFSISNSDQALYWVFSSICEENFFRRFLLSFRFLFKGNNWNVNILLNLGQAIAFAAFHQNYYNNPPVLISVFCTGLVFGLFYLFTNNITAIMGGHFALNLYATMQWWVRL